jgi:hypothetical protein
MRRVPALFLPIYSRRFVAHPSAYAITMGSGALIPVSPLLGSPFSTGTAPSGIAHRVGRSLFRFDRCADRPAQLTKRFLRSAP